MARAFGFGSAWTGLLRPKVALTGLGVAALSASAPHLLEMLALKRLPTRAFGILMSLEPGVAALIGFLAWGEHLSVLQAAGILAIVAASAGATVTISEGREN